VGVAAAWARANLDEPGYEAFKGMLQDQRSLDMVEKFISLSRTGKVPVNPDAYGKAYSKEEVQAEFRKTDENGKNLYETSPEHRTRVQRMLSQQHD